MKKYQFKKLGKWKKITIKRMRIKFDRKKNLWRMKLLKTKDRDNPIKRKLKK